MSEPASPPDAASVPPSPADPAGDPLPWTRLGDGPVASHRILSVRDVRVADPRSGREFERVVIDCPDWVNVVATTADGALVLVRQFRFGTWSNTLEIPGGMIDGGEAPAHAAARELEEETGYRPARVEAIGMCHPNPAIQGNRLFTFRATGCVRVHGGAPDAGEDLRVVVRSRAEVMDAVRSGEITHALVLAALLFDGLPAVATPR